MYIYQIIIIPQQQNQKDKQMYRSQEHPQTKIYDEDIEHLKSLISKLINSKQDTKVKYDDSERIAKLEQQNRDLSFKIGNLSKIEYNSARENKELIRQLLIQRQENTQLKATLSEMHQSAFDKHQPEPSQLKIQSKYIETLSPSQNKIYQSENLQPKTQFFSPLAQNQSSSLNRDQLYRLNSYLIQYNTNIKLLVQKYNYLVKLRGLNFPSDPQELKVLNQANQIFSNRKTIEQAKSILKSSRKKYFDSQSSSDIEDQCNQIEQST